MWFRFCFGYIGLMKPKKDCPISEGINAVATCKCGLDSALVILGL